MKLITLPGLIDPHVHLRDPGQTEKEDFYTGTSAALAGGYTTILDMPNNKIPITTGQRLKEKIKTAKQKIVCDVGFYFGSVGDNIKVFAKVIDKVKGLKLYLNETTGNLNFQPLGSSLEKIFKEWQRVGKKPILVHAEDRMIDLVVDLVKKTGQRVHVCHVSTKQDFEQILKAKKDNLPVTCGVTPHHLFLTEHDLPHLGPFGMMRPPLASKKDQQFLWSNINSIDVIESDHAPHTKEEKGSCKPYFGVPGLETTLPLLLTAVSDKRLKIKEIIRLCHTNPSRIFNIQTDEETKIEVDTHKSSILNHKSLHTKCGWTPFAGMTVKGKVIRTFIRGTKVFEDGKILSEPGWGRVVTHH